MKSFLHLFLFQMLIISAAPAGVTAAEPHGGVLFRSSHLILGIGLTALFSLLLISTVLSILLFKKKQGQTLQTPVDSVEVPPKYIETDKIKYELARTRKKYNELLDTILDGYAEFTLNGDILNINNTVADIFNCRPEALIGQHHSKLMSVTKNTDIAKAFKTIFKTGQPAKIKNVEVTGIDATRRIVEISASLMTGDDGEPEGFRAIFRDITELTTAEINRNLLEARLLRSQQVEAIGTLAGGIAHDFNNLLMAVQGNISILRFNMKKNNPLYEKLINIETCVQRGAELTKQLLGFSAGKSSGITHIDINKLAAETVETFKKTKKNIEVFENFSTDIWQIEADPNQLKQVILNLFINSWQTSSNKTLYVGTENARLASAAANRLSLEPGQYIRMNIANSDGDFSDIQSFNNVTDPRSNINAGIGIASSSEMIKSYNGLVEFKQRNNDETSYTIHFPIPGKKPVQEIETIHIGESCGGTILFVDDEEMIIDVGKPMLEELGYSVLVARGGKEAIQVYEMNKNKIDLVILDMVMPPVDAEEVYATLKAINSDVKTILSSGYNLDDQVDGLLKKGCNGFIQKPFNLKRLSGQIRKVINC